MNALELIKEMHGSDLTMVDFWAPWCGPCKMMKPILESVEEDNPRVKLIKINVDESPDLAGQFNVRNIPTVVFFRGDDEIQRAIGIKQKNQLQEIIDSNLP
jgi:thioredoxin 1